MPNPYYLAEVGENGWSQVCESGAEALRVCRCRFELLTAELFIGWDTPAWAVHRDGVTIAKGGGWPKKP